MSEQEDVLIDRRLLEVASPGQKAHYAKLLQSKKARRSTLDYMLYDSPERNKAYRHTVLLDQIVSALVNNRLYKDGPGPESVVIDITEDEPHGRRVHPVTGEPIILKLMTSMPPRIGKSFFFGQYFPAWYLTTRPDETIMYMSYAASLAENFARRSRNTIAEHPELGALLDPENQSTREYGIAGHYGTFIARGFGGIPTGRGGNLLIDDPFQDGEEAMSDNRRDFVWNQYISSLLTRVERGCWTILNATRWHEDDLHGRLLELEPDEWFYLNLPALAFDDVNDDGVSIDVDTGQVDFLNRRPGEAICPQLYPASFYKQRQNSDPFWFDAEYMGKPSGIGGGLFKEFDHYKKIWTSSEGDGNRELIYELVKPNGDSDFVSEKDCVRFGTVDLAATEGETADWYVMAIWDLDPWNRLLLRHIIREHITAGTDEDWLRKNSKLWNLSVLGIEKSTYDFKMVRNMIAKGGITLWPLKPDKSKKVRALPAAILVKNHFIYADRDADWLAKWESEHKKFDKDKNDDQVDTTSYAAIMRDLLVSKEIPILAPPSGLDEFEERLAQLAHAESEIPKNSGMVING